ncbi:ABC transporter substrate-binding protein [Pseudomonas sp. NPDC007930]|uniref:ABC transporter substrate-binding protein n=1 Tax=Pseudomonas sp. NPDC007930 TaxID=3364417 RepID=UPI0036E6DB61
MGDHEIDTQRRHILKMAGLAAGAVAFAGTGPAWASSSATPAIDRDTLVVGLDKSFANLNAVVAVTSDSDRYTLLVFDRLYAFDKVGNLRPSLATSVEVSADGLAYTFQLRKGVQFHHGGELSAADVKFTMELALDPATKSSRRPFFAPYVDGVDVLGEHTVRFRLKQPDGAFQNKLAGYLPILPANYGSSVPAVEFFSRTPVATGAYRVKAFSADGNQLELERFEGYWGRKPAIRRIVMRTIKDETNRLNALLAGEVDVVVGVAPQSFAALNASAGLAAIANPVASPLIIRPYTRDPSLPLSHREVRQALNYAIDKDAIIKTVQYGIGEPLASGISRYYPYGANPALKPYPYDPAKARQLLAAAGFANGFSTKLLCPNDYPKGLSEAIAAYWGQVGVKVEIQLLDYATFVQWNDTRRTTPMTVQQGANAIYDPVHTVGGIFVKSGAWSDYSNPGVEALFAEVAPIVDTRVRGEIFQRIGQILHDDAAAIFLSEIHRVYGRKRALDWTPSQGTAALNFLEARWA